MISSNALRMLVLHGPNLNLLGTRQPSLYGHCSLDEINTLLLKKAAKNAITLDIKQTNIEGELVTYIQQTTGTYDAILLNPAGYTHTSIAIYDALIACGVPAVEIHLTHLSHRNRNDSKTAPACIGQIMGFGKNSYLLGLDAAHAHVKELVNSSGGS